MHSSASFGHHAWRHAFVCWSLAMFALCALRADERTAFSKDWQLQPAQSPGTMPTAEPWAASQAASSRRTPERSVPVVLHHVGKAGFWSALSPDSALVCGARDIKIWIQGGR